MSCPKHLSDDALKTAIQTAQKHGMTVVFTNGCFDLLHPGHVQLLEGAKRLGDLLVVAINSDRSVKTLKGASRPILDETERIVMLSALACVDYIAVFDDDTPIRLLEFLRPDVLVKGMSYTPDQVVGREVVEGYGGRIERVTIREGVSTTQLIERIVKSAGP
ncbi:MAG: D-glycero-beta-D-manno-heptose 1-phosphate adenylyltransferase [candidate division Zixibacteria bacterium]|nr:D-glycero-beta-D-manno-heptose 1-phosphate adenylyltransferase [candidate division Zixibacteria bacterium]